MSDLLPGSLGACRLSSTTGETSVASPVMSYGLKTCRAGDVVSVSTENRSDSDDVSQSGHSDEIEQCR
jgi:hypothetical protein